MVVAPATAARGDAAHTGALLARERHSPTASGATEAGACFSHETLLYSGRDEFLAGCVPFIEEALEREEPVLAAVAPERIAQLRDALGEAAARVGFADMHALGANPARIIPAWHQFLAAHPRSRGAVRGIGEPVWPGRGPAELTECERHEALLNLAFGGGRPWRMLCPYDVDCLEDSVIEGALRNHPFLASEGRCVASERYSDRTPDPFAGVLPDPGGEVRELPFTACQLGQLRAVLTEWALEAQLADERVREVVLAVNELASNSVRHGGGEGTLRVWREAGSLMCEVADAGRLEDLLAGRVRAAPDASTGRGLWLANKLCDLVQIRSGRDGTVVRAHVRLGRAIV